MKKIVSLVSVVIGVNAFAAEGLDANLFSCKATGGTQVTYSSSSFTGDPQMSVQFRNEQVRADGKVELEHTLIGTLATIRDFHLTPVDGPETLYTLVVPIVKVTPEQGARFSTTLVRTSVASHFEQVGSFVGPLQRSEFVPVDCEAQHVLF